MGFQVQPGNHLKLGRCNLGSPYFLKRCISNCQVHSPFSRKRLHTCDCHCSSYYQFNVALSVFLKITSRMSEHSARTRHHRAHFTGTFPRTPPGLPRRCWPISRGRGGDGAQGTALSPALCAQQRGQINLYVSINGIPLL